MTTALGSVGWAYRDSLSSGTEYRCMNVGNLTIRPKQVNKGLDSLKLKGWLGVGVVIVVCEWENHLHGEGPQLLKKNSERNALLQEVLKTYGRLTQNANEFCP